MRTYLLVLLFVCLMVSDVMAAASKEGKSKGKGKAATANEPEKLLETTRILWVASMTVDDKKADAGVIASNLETYLKPLGFNNLPGRTNASLAKKCDVAALLAGTYCEPITNADADIIVAVDAQVKSQAPDRKGILGAKMTMDFRLFRTDTKKQFGKMKQLPFAKGQTQDKAIQTAIRKVQKPISILFSKTTNATLAMREITAELTISGLPKKEIINDMLQVFPQVRGLKETRVTNLAAPTASFRLTYTNTYLNALVNRINETQGTGVTLSLDGPLSIRGVYDPARGYFQLLSMTDVKNSTRDASQNGLCARITEDLEKEFAKLPYVIVDRPDDKRLPANLSKAKQQMKTQLGGHLVVMAELKKGRQGPTLSIEVHHVQYGLLFRHTIENADLTTSWMSSIKGELDDKLLAALKKQVRGMDKVTADQFRAYLQRSGRG